MIDVKIKLFEKPYINLIAEIGINHNGNLESAFEMIKLAKDAGFDYVKFQKRDPDLCVPEHEKNRQKIVPWRTEPTTYLQYKKDIEFSQEDYNEIDKLCKVIGIKWFASVWDIPSAEFLRNFDIDIIKIPSAHLTNHELIQRCKDLQFNKLMISTGMSFQQEIEDMYYKFQPDVILHTNACYPTELKSLYLGYISKLFNIVWDKEKDRYLSDVGYSNHCPNELALYFAASWDITWMEMHVTLSKAAWGSDQKSSFELSKLKPIIDNIRLITKEYNGVWEGMGQDRILYSGEEEKRKSLRGY